MAYLKSRRLMMQLITLPEATDAQVLEAVATARRINVSLQATRTSLLKHCKALKLSMRQTDDVRHFDL